MSTLALILQDSATQVRVVASNIQKTNGGAVRAVVTMTSSDGMQTKEPIAQISESIDFTFAFNLFNF